VNYYKYRLRFILILSFVFLFYYQSLAQLLTDSLEVSKYDTISFVDDSESSGYLWVVTNIDSFYVVIDGNFAQFKKLKRCDLLKLPCGQRSITLISQFDLDANFKIKILEDSTIVYRNYFGKDINIQTYLKYSSYPYLIQGVDFTKNDTINFVKDDYPYGYLWFASNLDSFCVVLDHDYHNYKKLYKNDFLRLPVGKRNITISSPFDIDLNFNIKILPDTIVVYKYFFNKNVNKKMYTKFSSYPRLMQGYNLIIVSDNDTEIWMDGKYLDYGYCEVDTFSGEYNIEMVNKFTGSIQNRIPVVQNRISIYEMYTKPNKNISLYLSIFPGISQYYKNEKLKGISLFGITTLGFIMSHIQHQSYLENYNLYIDSKNIYELAEKESEALKLGNEMEHYYNKAKKNASYRNLFLYSSLILYLYNFIDAWFHEPKGGYRKKRSLAIFDELQPIVQKESFGIGLPLKISEKKDVFTHPKTQFSEKQSKFGISLNSGITVQKSPNNFTQWWSHGFNLGVGFEYRIISNFALKGEIDFNYFSINQEKFLEDHGYGERNYSFDHGEAILFSGIANIKYILPLSLGMITPYIVGGGGVLLFNTSDISFMVFSGVPFSMPGISTPSILIDYGIGFEMPMIRKIKLYTEAKYYLGFTKFEQARYTLFDSTEYTKYVSIKFGILF